MEQETVMTMRVSQELRAWIQKRADRLHTTPSGFIRTILEFFKEMEEGVGS